MTPAGGAAEALWRGVVISESLEDPTILNGLACRGFHITEPNLPLDDPGALGRWHLYWLEVGSVPWAALEANLKPSWYAHFWRDAELRVVFRGKTFVLDGNDQTSWAPAVEYGRALGIPAEQLDFPRE